MIILYIFHNYIVVYIIYFIYLFMVAKFWDFFERLEDLSVGGKKVELESLLVSQL